ncbi:hypothetical protein [Acinetobacter haemolyticus]|uniref:hypothetical protein n=1 Tax=Acinetobacter haemolyticus TaxID=29430 RepID=UPI000F746910|nr:hypothetical protein [Acinetobacter haemolyticus]RSN77928.1 hypothetical protein EA769_03660 [Acinetobacter haemolyticus]
MADNKENIFVRYLDFNFAECSQFKEFNYEQEMTPIQKRMYFLMLHSNMPRGESESLYGWAGRIGLSRSTVFGIFSKDNAKMHNSVAHKISEATGANEQWIQSGVGEAFDKTKKESNVIQSEGLQITTEIDRDKLQQAFETTDQALKEQHKTMQPKPKAEFIVMLYTALIDSATQSFDKNLLNTAIYLVENELSTQRRSMSHDKKTLLIIAIYTLYIDSASNIEALELSIKNLIRSAA